MSSEWKRKIFSWMTVKFETDYVRDYFLDMSELIPDYFFYMPASTSKRFHSLQQVDLYGQLNHVFMQFQIAEYLLDLKYNHEIRFKSNIQRDLIRCVPGLHDAFKCGEADSKFTVHEHPQIAADWVLNTSVEHDIDMKYKRVLAAMIASHSGQWSTSNRSTVVLPEPKNDMQIFAHEIDILSSRSDLYWKIPTEVTDLFKMYVPDELKAEYTRKYGSN